MHSPASQHTERHVINTFNTDIMHKPITSLNVPQARCRDLEPGVTILPRGFQKADGCRALEVDTIWERDLIIPLRDGTQLRGDIFRPQHSAGRIPILLVWTPYGKTGTGEFSSLLLP
jgi:predicted acyl esterase